MYEHSQLCLIQKEWLSKSWLYLTLNAIAEKTISDVWRKVDFFPHSSLCQDGFFSAEAREKKLHVILVTVAQFFFINTCIAQFIWDHQALQPLCWVLVDFESPNKSVTGFKWTCNLLKGKADHESRSILDDNILDVSPPTP